MNIRGRVARPEWRPGSPRFSRKIRFHTTMVRSTPVGGFCQVSRHCPGRRRLASPEDCGGAGHLGSRLSNHRLQFSTAILTGASADRTAAIATRARGAVPRRGGVRQLAAREAVAGRVPLPRPPARAPARLGLRAGQRRQGHPRPAGAAGPQQHPAHRTHVKVVQEFLGGRGLKSGTRHLLCGCRRVLRHVGVQLILKIKPWNFPH